MSKHLLVIDDEQDIRDVVKVSLEEFAGWQVETASSGEEGLQKVKTGKWDAILLDVSMPDLDGFSVFEQLQANSATKTIPVVLLTAKVLPSDRRRFAEMGVTGVIVKPFNPVTVWNQVAQILKW
ncbi:MAG: response regulator [Phormidium sp.]